MTQDDIILMARKVAINGWHPERGEWFEFNHESLERFAALVAEATKEKAAKVCLTQPFSQGDFAEEIAAAIRSMK